MPLQVLALLDRRGSATKFANPNNIHTVFNHRVEVKNRNVGKGKQSVFRNEFALAIPRLVESCDGTCATEVIDSIRVTLSGSDKANLLQHWEDMKRNVDKALTTTHVLNGMPLPWSGIDFDVTVPAPVVPVGP